MAKLMCVPVIVLVASLAGSPRAQAQSDQQESIADAARRSREQKKEAAKPASVITNDTLEPLKPETPAARAGAPTSAVTAAPGGSATTDTSAAPAPAAGEQPTATPAAAPLANETEQGAAAKQEALKLLKQQIAELQKDVDLAQRELNLANADFYSKPDFSKDDAGKANLDAMKNDLAQKSGELEQLKAQLPAGADVKEEKPAENESPTPPQSQPQPNTAPQP